MPFDKLPCHGLAPPDAPSLAPWERRSSENSRAAAQLRHHPSYNGQQPCITKDMSVLAELPFLDSVSTRLSRGPGSESSTFRVRSMTSMATAAGACSPSARNDHSSHSSASSDPSSPLCVASEMSGLPHSPPDGMVHVRSMQRVSHNGARIGPGSDRTPQKGWKGYLNYNFQRLSRRCGWSPGFEREAFVLIIAGLVLGALLHGYVFWRGLRSVQSVPDLTGLRDAAGSARTLDNRRMGTHLTSHPAIPSVAPLHDNKNSPRPRKIPGLRDSWKPPNKLGMPGDSDVLPRTPVWNASAWHGPERIPPSSPAWPNTVAVCSLMKNEHPDDVVEWLKYHKWIGVDQVFLRENGDLDPALKKRLQPHVDSGFLDLGELPGPKHPLQNRWYNRCSKPDMAGLHSWIAFIDLDEFIVLLDDGMAAKNPDLKLALKPFRGNAGLSMQWVIFGSSGHEERPKPGGPLGHYSQCTGKLSYQMKCMANMYHAAHHMMVGNTVHDCTYRYEAEKPLSEPPVTASNGLKMHLFENTGMTNPNRDPALGMSRTYIGHLNSTTYDPVIKNAHKLALFHYVTRSLEDYTTRKIHLPSGLYTHLYVQQGRKQHDDLHDMRTMRAFEHSNGFDGDAEICKSAVIADYATRI